MASPNPNQYLFQGQTLASRSSQQDINQSYRSPPYAQQTAPYVQPHYANTSPVHIIAELPAPLPPAPPTTTSDQQLKEDELLAHKLQQMEVAEIRNRSPSAVEQQQRSVSVAPLSAHNSPLLTQQPSTQSLRSHSQSLSSNSVPWSPGSLGPLSGPLIETSNASSLPEVVTGSHFADASENLPIPVFSEQPQNNSLSMQLNPISLSNYLEEHRQVPYPPQWKLPPVTATFYAYSGPKSVPGSDWLSQQETFTWRTIRPTENAYNPAAPAYTFKFTAKGGSYRDPRLSWTMTCPDETTDLKKRLVRTSKPAWTYDLRLDLMSGMRKTEALNHGSKKAILTTYVHALNYDSLRFIGPDGRAYMWVSSGQVGSIGGVRFDTNRHALFASTGQIPDPLYGEIVADHTFWDGYVDRSEVHVGIKCDGCQTTPIKGLRWKCRTCHKHDVCETCRTAIFAGEFGSAMQQKCRFSLVNLPDEALYIRSLLVDPALVVATLQVLKDWELNTLREEKRKYVSAFAANEEEMRRSDLGVMSYWRASDWDKKNTANDKKGTMVKARSMDEVKAEVSGAMGNLVDAGFALGGHGHGGGGDGGGGGGGGGGSS